MSKFLEIVVIDDYHDFNSICKSFVKKNLSFKELGSILNEDYPHLMYVGVIYDGDLPGLGEIDDALIGIDIDMNDLD